jgi:predicted nucleic acid-binding protein
LTAFFFDSSALIKRYVTEAGSDWVRAQTSSEENQLTIAQITPVELISAIVRRVRENSVNQQDARDIRLLIDRHIRREYTVIAFTMQIANVAEDLLEKYPLRAADSIQLASALEANRKLLTMGMSPLTFICSDQRLLNAAQAEALPAYNPG